MDGERSFGCSVNHLVNPFYFNVESGFYEPSEEEREQAVWAHIDKAFSALVTQNENKAHYAPTQIIAELFKRNGFDGVAYKSMLSDGHTIVLFDPKSAEMLNCSLYELKKITFEFSHILSGYSITKPEI